MHAAAARTTSMLASAALLGALAIAGLTMSISFTPPQIPDSTRPIAVLEEQPPAPPPTVFRPHPPPQTDQTPAETTTAPLDQPMHIEAISTDNTSTGPVIPMIVNPHWLRRPTNLQAYYPRRALQRSVEGVVQLDCRVLTSGNLQCTVMSETPSGWAFGAAAQRIAADHRMTPAMRDGVPVEGRYQMRVPFRLN